MKWAIIHQQPNGALPRSGITYSPITTVFREAVPLLTRSSYETDAKSERAETSALKSVSVSNGLSEGAPVLNIHMFSRAE